MDSGPGEDHHDENDYKNGNYSYEDNIKCGFRPVILRQIFIRMKLRLMVTMRMNFEFKVLGAICSIGIMSTKLDTVLLTSAR